VGYGLIPFFMRLPITSAYEILEGRLGVSIRLLGSTIFTLTRLVWMSLLIYLTAKSMVVILGWAPEMIPYVVAVAGLVTVVYTVMGGLRGVVMTNAVQFFIQIGGAILTIILITQRMGGVEAWFPTSWAPNWDVQPFFSLDPFMRATVVGAILNSVVFWTCTAGSDQIAIQRYLATRDTAAARRAFLINLIASSSVLIILALLGFALLGFFRANPHLISDGRSLIADADFLFPHYLANYLPVGVAGLVVVGIFADAMSSLSSALNSISSVFMVDFLGRFQKHKNTARRQVSLARYLTFGIGVVVVLISSVMDHVPGNLQEVAVKTSALFMVPLFVLFFMALFVPFATSAGAAIGAFYSFMAAALFSFWDVLTGQPRLSFQWISIVALLAGVTSGLIVSLVPVQKNQWSILTAWSLFLGVPIITLWYTLR
jgi:solute:Na+ symporter, SSS family